jgi:hypothetical protein
MRQISIIRALLTVFVVSIAFVWTTVIAQDAGWRSVSPNLKWDTKSGSRSQNVITVWYEIVFVEEARETLRRAFGDVVYEITTGRFRVGIDCSQKLYATLDVIWLNDRKNPVLAPHSVPKNEVKWESISPESNMEGLSQDVCRTVRR